MFARNIRAPSADVRRAFAPCAPRMLPGGRVRHRARASRNDVRARLCMRNINRRRQRHRQGQQGDDSQQSRTLEYRASVSHSGFRRSRMS
jgi:hypothetical protein